MIDVDAVYASGLGGVFGGGLLSTSRLMLLRKPLYAYIISSMILMTHIIASNIVLSRLCTSNVLSMLMLF